MVYTEEVAVKSGKGVKEKGITMVDVGQCERERQAGRRTPKETQRQSKGWDGGVDEAL